VRAIVVRLRCHAAGAHPQVEVMSARIKPLGLTYMPRPFQHSYKLEGEGFAITCGAFTSLFLPFGGPLPGDHHEMERLEVGKLGEPGHRAAEVHIFAPISARAVPVDSKCWIIGASALRPEPRFRLTLILAERTLRVTGVGEENAGGLVVQRRRGEERRVRLAPEVAEGAPCLGVRGTPA
jgi:hypothetical protein